MCGIICFVTSKHKISDSEIAPVKNNIRNRGPDFFDEKSISVDIWNIYFGVSILHTQGKFLTRQPVISSRGDILLWNGDVFGGDLVLDKSRDISDTQLVADKLKQMDGNVPEVLRTIEGPYSFVYFDRKRKRLWFGRDPLGRHSLLWKLSGNHLFISSTGHKVIPDLIEVSASGLFCIVFSENITDMETHFYRWNHWNEHLSSDDAEFPEFVRIGHEIQHRSFSNLWTCCNDAPYVESFFKSSVISDDVLDIMYSLLANTLIEKSVQRFLDLLIESCEKRVTIRRNICKNCSSEKLCSAEHVKIGILFSGGLDSTVIACLADKFVPKEESIDLLNVAFNRNGTFNVPDRNTAFVSLGELQALCPSRIWNLVEINVTDEELAHARENYISHLIYPLKTILDESLGCALWFACLGKGSVCGIPYSSCAKILLLGTGADEQLGGYMRHRNLLKRYNWETLKKQLLKETMDISKRNLGRDDRISCDSGRQSRFPFLDERVVKYLAGLPPWQKCDPVSFPPGMGDKLILRLVAVKLGLRQCATFPKRAFQFGCRIAKSKEKGHRRSERL